MPKQIRTYLCELEDVELSLSIVDSLKHGGDSYVLVYDVLQSCQPSEVPTALMNGFHDSLDAFGDEFLRLGWMFSAASVPCSSKLRFNESFRFSVEEPIDPSHEAPLESPVIVVQVLRVSKSSGKQVLHALCCLSVSSDVSSGCSKTMTMPLLSVRPSGKYCEPFTLLGCTKSSSQSIDTAKSNGRLSVRTEPNQTLARMMLMSRAMFLCVDATIVASAFAALANILMRADAIRTPNRAPLLESSDSRDEGGRTSTASSLTSSQPSGSEFILLRPKVRAAISCYLIAGILDFVALAVIPLSVRAVSSCLTIPFNGLFASAILKERMSRVQTGAAAVSVMATILAMLFAGASKSEGALPDGSPSLEYIFARLLDKDTVWLLLLVVAVHVFLAAFNSAVIQTQESTSSGSGIDSDLAVVENSNASIRATVRPASIFLLISSVYCASFQTAATNVLGKIVGVFVVSSLASGDKFVHIHAIVLASGLILINACFQLMMVSNMLKLFPAVIAIPPYQISILSWLVLFSSLIFGESPSNPTGFVVCLGVALLSTVVICMYPAKPRLVSEIDTDSLSPISRPPGTGERPYSPSVSNML